MEKKCQNADFESTPGRSIGVIRDNSSQTSGCVNGSVAGCYEVNVGTITKTNSDFVMPEKFTYKAMSVKGCVKAKAKRSEDCIIKKK